MGYEWSVKTKNKSLNEMLPFIQKLLLDEGINNFTADSKRISVTPNDDGSDWGMEFIIEDDYLYHLNYVGERIVEQVRQALEENGFDIVVEEL